MTGLFAFWLVERGITSKDQKIKRSKDQKIAAFGSSYRGRVFRRHEKNYGYHIQLELCL
ncbi:hypothetical protein EMIT0P253_350039 [Pseudomonas sp. IT-P253]